MRRAHHPNIVNLERVYEGDDHVHLVMELIEGEMLLDLIVRLRLIPETLC
jgi:serine/threonine protein kinase